MRDNNDVGYCANQKTCVKLYEVKKRKKQGGSVPNRIIKRIILTPIPSPKNKKALKIRAFWRCGRDSFAFRLSSFKLASVSLDI